MSRLVINAADNRQAILFASMIHDLVDFAMSNLRQLEQFLVEHRGEPNGGIDDGDCKEMLHNLAALHHEICSNTLLIGAPNSDGTPSGISSDLASKIIAGDDLMNSLPPELSTIVKKLLEDLLSPSENDPDIIPTRKPEH